MNRDYQNRFETLITYIEENYHKKIDLDLLADISHF